MAPTAPAAQGTRRAAVTEEERRRNRMTSNRLSARKSRMKRQQHVKDLTATLERLGRENAAMRASVDGALRRCCALEQENRVLAAPLEIPQVLFWTDAVMNAAVGMLGF